MRELAKEPNTARALGIFVAVLGIATAILPHYVFPVCEYFGLRFELAPRLHLPMYCWYTAMAEVGVGVVVATAGLILFFSKRNETRRALGFTLCALGILVAIMPTYLIPVCPEVWHPCRIATLPGLVLVGCAIIVVAIVTIVAFRGEDRT